MWSKQIMELKAFTKKDIVVVLGCVLFLLINLGAIGSSGRRQAKESVCLSNLCKWGVAFQMYTKDNDGFFIEGRTSREANYWLDAMRSYYENNRKLCCCPEATKPVTEVGRWGTFSAWGIFGDPGSWGIGEAGDYGSYGHNCWTHNPPGDYMGFRSRYWNTINVKNADNIPLFLDGMWIGGFAHHFESPPPEEGYFWDAGGSGIKVFCIPRHNGSTINGLFMDLSVRKVGLKELWKLKWHRNFDTDGPWTKAGGVTPSYWPPWMRKFKDY
jgi:hypothetical protein